MSWMQTHSGVHFDFDNPTVDMINIEDIAHSLAHQCRYAGHTNWHYSIAQHSYYMSHLVPEKDRFEALMHDAHEAYCQDMVHAMKEQVSDYGFFEERIRFLVVHKYDLNPFGLPVSVLKADREICLAELYQLFDDNLDYTLEDLGYEPADVNICKWSAGQAQVRFLHRFEELRYSS